MKYSITLCAGLFVSLTMASPIARDSVSGVVSLPVVHRLKDQKVASNSEKRRRSYGETLDNDLYAYFADINVGTPGQPNTVQIDTGSSDLWVFSPSEDTSTSFNADDSSTYEYENSDFYISYVSGSASGDWVSDDVSWGSVDISSQTFGLVSSGDAGTNGVFGIGYMADESSYFSYVNFPQNLVDQGYIAHNAYSLYLDDIDASSGALLFGGVDSGKYTGQLYTVPVESSTSFKVTVSEITYGDTTISGGSFKGILDSGTSFTYLPTTQFNSLISALGATYVSSQGAYFLNSPPAEGVTYNFSGAKVTVPPSELAIPVSEVGVSGIGYEYFVPIFDYSNTEDYVLLGDSFLRSAYVVYDLDNNEISIAQSSFDSSSSDIQAITDSVPGAKPAPDL